MVAMERIGKDQYKIVCPFCKKEQILNLRDDAVANYRSGALVQQAFPELSADDREVIVSGICPDCWSNMFGDED